MREQREQILFVSVLVLVGGLGWMRVSDRYPGTRVPAAKTLETEALALPPTIRLGSLGELDAGSRDRTAFAPPRELLPLEPLVLPDPPLPRLSVRRPAVTPSLAGTHARAYRVPAESLGDLVLAEGEDAGLGQDDLGGDDGAPAPAGGGEPGDETNGASEELYDWVVRGTSTARVPGRILNTEPHGLRDRGGEDIEFQMVSKRTGGPVGAPFVIPRSDVADFGLARTFENDYLARSRTLGKGPGSVSARKALVLELLAAWPAEARALEFATTEARLAHAYGAGDPTAARVLATVLAAANDVEGQLAVYVEAEQGGFADATLLADHAGLARSLGLRQRAWELLERARALSRSSPEVALLEGLLAADEGRWDEALAALRGAGQVGFAAPFEDRQRRELGLVTGRVLIAVGKAADAEREAERLLLKAPADSDALALRGAAQAAQDELEDAQQSFAAALAADPSNGELLTNAAIVAWLLDDGAGAVRLASLARDVDPYRAVGATLALGFFHEDADELQTARDFYAEALQQEPDHPEALYRLGRSQRLEGDPDGAGRTLGKALRVAGPDALLLTELGRAALDSDAPPAAARYLREALRLEPDNGEVLELLGLAHLLDGDLLTAIEVLEQASAAARPGAHAGLGVAFYRRGVADEALRHFDEVARAFAGRPEHPSAVFAAAQTLAIRDNLGKRQWLDRFGRSSLQRGWTERQWDGSPRVFLEGANLRIQGRMEKPREDERPGITRSVDGNGFVSAEAEVRSAAPGGRLGLSLTYRQVRGVQGRLPKASVDLWVDAEGAVRLSALDNFTTVVFDGEPVGGLRVAVGDPVRLGIERVDDVAGTFAISVDGRSLGPVIELRSLRNFKNLFDLDVYGEAPPGQACDVLVSMVRMVRIP